MLQFLANHVTGTMYFGAHRAIVMAVIAAIMIQRAIRIIGNPDFLPTAIPVIVIQIPIGIGRI
jgi:hypothetical protein